MNRRLILWMSLGLAGCLADIPEPLPTPKATTTPTAWAHPFPQPTPTPTPSPTRSPPAGAEPVYPGWPIYCHKLELSSFKPKLRYPVDVAVSGDGHQIHIINKRCDTLLFNETLYLSAPPFDFQDCRGQQDDKSVYQRQFIYTLSQDQKLKVLTLKGDPPFSCQLREEIEVDTKGNLYTATLDQQLLRLSPKDGTVENLAQVSQKSGTPFSMATGLPDPFPGLQGPYHLSVNKTSQDLYFWMDNPDANGANTINRLNLILSV